MTLLLVRHARHGLLDRVLAGRMPGVSLSETGRAEAGRLARGLADRGIGRVLSSPLERTRETAAAIAERAGCGVEIRDEINEIDCGEWTGASFESVGTDPRWHAWNAEREFCGIPGGETMATVQTRAMSLVGRLTAEGEGTVALVSHSDVIKAVICGVLGLSLGRHDHLVVDPASVTTVLCWDGYARVLRTNEVFAS